jgi:uncharacterized protein YjiS (DUF1127 family)
MNRTLGTDARQRLCRAPRPPLRVRLADSVLSWHERSRERARLAGLDARLRHDLGLSSADVASESEKPFWRA